VEAEAGAEAEAEAEAEACRRPEGVRLRPEA
jgi:hypothetical protein